MSTEILSLLWQMFASFFVIGLFTFGGGYAVISLIQTKVVTEFGWLSESMFADIMAISQMTPGPIGINCATYVGYEVIHDAGASHLVSILGSATATFAVVLPSFLIVLALVRFYTRFHENAVFAGVMSALRPAVVGLLAAAALVLMFNIRWNAPLPSFSLIRDNFTDWKSWLLFAAALVASFRFKVSPIAVIIAGGILGFLLY